VSNTQTVTVVFTDLVDSTVIAEHLGPQAAEELRQTHFRLLRGAITGSGGTEVKNLGDGLMVTYSSPSRALAGAVGMQQAIDHHNRSGAQPLSVRVGASLGEAVEEDGDYFGDPVVEAARLCAAASGGQILTTDVVRALVGRHATQTFAEIGPLELKGIPSPVDVVEVLWEPVLVAGSIPLPGRLMAAATQSLFGFFGRGTELAVLEEASKRSKTSGQPQVVFVAGEAGMGKTMLVAQFARSAHAEGSAVLLGHSDEDLGIAYQPWIEALSMLVRESGPQLVDELRPAQRTALARLIPDVAAEGVRVADQDTERLLLLEATSELLAAASKSSPVVLVLDDLHWADNASLQLFRHVIASATTMNLTIVCTYRDTDLGRGDPLTKLLADLHRETNVTRIALAGLEDIEIVELMTAAAGHELDESSVGLAHAVRRETDGNPFFTAELLRHLAETNGIVTDKDGRWTVADDLDELGLPSSVRDVVGRRVERLGEEALRVLCLAAVVGREFDVSLLARVADVDEDALLDLMDAAVNAAVLVESEGADRYRFAHAMIQHSLYEELSPARRQRAHRHVGQLLEADGTQEDAVTLAELAHHWVAATRPADLDKAIDYVRRAGNAALGALAPEDAIRWFQQALDLVAGQVPPDEHKRAELLAALGNAQRLAARPEWRHTLRQAADLAQRIDDNVVLIQAALGFTQLQGSQNADDEAKQVIQAALDRIGSDPIPERALLLAALGSVLDPALEWRKTRELGLQAVELAERLGDDRTVIKVIDVTHFSLSTPDRRDQQRENIKSAVAMADRVGDPAQQALIRIQMLWATYQQADIRGADIVLAELEKLTEMVGLPWHRWQYAQVLTGRLLLSGRLDEAEATNERALELATQAGAATALTVFGGIFLQIRRYQGCADGEIADLIINAARDNPSISVMRASVASLLCELGRIEEARQRLAAEMEAGFDFPWDGSWLSSMSHLIDTAVTTGERDAADTLIDRLEPFSDHVISPASVVVSGAIARPLARAATLVGDYEKAEHWFAIAHDLHARLEAPYWTARGQLDHADLCIVRGLGGGLDRARDLIATAASTAAEYDFAGLARRAELLLAEL
jgi:class 3 adenylate cyclase/tetratricopeptide (TPR) repeat protein